MKYLIAIFLLCLPALAATKYPAYTDNANSTTFAGGATNFATVASLAALSNSVPASINISLLNGTNVLTGTNNFTGTVLITNAASTLSGNGAGLTNLNASNLASGTVPDARISSTFATSANLTTVSNSVNTLQTQLPGYTTNLGAMATNFTAYGLTINTGSTNNSLTASRAVVTDANKAVVSSAVTSTELGYVSGVTSGIQAQFNALTPVTNIATLNGTNVLTGTNRFSGNVIATNGVTLSGVTNSDLTASTVPYSDANKKLTSSAVTPTELGYVSGVTSAIQTQLGTKANLSGGNTFSGVQTFSSTPLISNTAGQLRLYNTTSATEWDLTSSTDNNFYLTSSGSSRFGVTPSGKVGLGSSATTGSQIVQVNGNMRITSNIYFNNNNGFLCADSGGTDRDLLYVDPSNNVTFGATGYSWNSIQFCFNSSTPKVKFSSSGLTVGTSGTVMKQVLSATATLDFNLTTVTVQDLTVTCTGAQLGDVVTVGVPNGSVTTTVQYTAWVSATDTVTVRAQTSAVGENPAAGTFRVQVTQF